MEKLCTMNLYQKLCIHSHKESEIQLFYQSHHGLLLHLQWCALYVNFPTRQVFCVHLFYHWPLVFVENAWKMLAISCNSVRPIAFGHMHPWIPIGSPLDPHWSSDERLRWECFLQNSINFPKHSWLKAREIFLQISSQSDVSADYAFL